MAKKDKKKKDLEVVEGETDIVDVVEQPTTREDDKTSSPPSSSSSSSSSTTTTLIPPEEVANTVNLNVDEIDEAAEKGGSHLSVLISTIRKFSIGQDLTNIKWPGAFILPKSSLSFFAENYAAHFDLLVAAVDIQDDKERMLQVYRYVMSTFKVYKELTKKPLNPVLGETIKGHAHFIDSSNGTPFTKVQVMAEQIQHHPHPISCTIAYNKESGVSASYYHPARSNFMGTFVKFSLEGEFIIKLDRFGEVYRISMASLAVRFLRGFIEFIGKTEMTCNKNDHRIKTTFYPKPLFYGSYNSCEAVVYKGKEKLHKIKGNWDQELLINSSYKQNDYISFLNRKDMVPSILDFGHPDQQLETDSTKVWKGVIDAANRGVTKDITKEKTKVEDHQRKLAAERKEKGIKWHPIHFHRQDDEWILNEYID